MFLKLSTQIQIVFGSSAKALSYLWYVCASWKVEQLLLTSWNRLSLSILYSARSSPRCGMNRKPWRIWTLNDTGLVYVVGRLVGLVDDWTWELERWWCGVWPWRAVDPCESENPFRRLLVLVLCLPSVFTRASEREVCRVYVKDIQWRRKYLQLFKNKIKHYLPKLVFSGFDSSVCIFLLFLLTRSKQPAHNWLDPTAKKKHGGEETRRIFDCASWIILLQRRGSLHEFWMF